MGSRAYISTTEGEGLGDNDLSSASDTSSEGIGSSDDDTLAAPTGAVGVDGAEPGLVCTGTSANHPLVPVLAYTVVVTVRGSGRLFHSEAAITE